MLKAQSHMAVHAHVHVYFRDATYVHFTNHTHTDLLLSILDKEHNKLHLHLRIQTAQLMVASVPGHVRYVHVLIMRGRETCM